MPHDDKPYARRTGVRVADATGAASTSRRLAASWLALLAATLLLIARYPQLPEAIPAYRTLWGAPLHPLPKSAFSVLRIIAMGVGQLGATTVMASEATRAQQPRWVAFWVAASLAAAAKTLIESVQYALLGVFDEPRLATTFFLAALLPVAAFLVIAVRLWRARILEPRVGISLPSSFKVAGFISLWLGCALLPAWMTP